MSLSPSLVTPQSQLRAASFTSVNTTAGNETINLGLPENHVGWRLTYLKFDSSSNTVSIANNGVEIVRLVKQGESVTVYSDGTNWIVIIPPTVAYIQDILDSFGHELINFHTGGPAAVNYARLTNANTGGPVTLEAIGADTDVTLQLISQGAGTVDIQGGGLSIQGQKVLSGTPPAAPSTASLTGATKTWADALTVLLQGQGILS